VALITYPPLLRRLMLEADTVGWCEQASASIEGVAGDDK
jgi:hypothetical protein